VYWACAQVEPRRERLASHCLALAGYQLYQPLLREQRRSHGRKIIVTPPLFPGYLFLWVVSGWWNARWAAGVRRLVMDGQVLARVPDAVIAEIRSRERNGFVELPRPRGLTPGTRVRVTFPITLLARADEVIEYRTYLLRCVRTRLAHRYRAANRSLSERSGH
jgi:transcriptional antiterminator RfaH